MIAKLEEKGWKMFDNLNEYIPMDITVRHAVETWRVACEKSQYYHSGIQGF